MKQKYTIFQIALKNYFHDFICFKVENVILILYITGMTIGFNWTSLKPKSMLVGIPILFTMISITFHTISLPFMMYVVPYNKKQRETYIQTMLYLKIGIPLCFAIIWDIISWFIHPVSIYACILQIVGIAALTYIGGTLHDGMSNSSTGKIAFGHTLKDFTPVILLLSFSLGMGLFGICIESVNCIEFLIIISVMLLIFLPICNAIRKRWPDIRSNFANYEIATWEVK